MLEAQKLTCVKGQRLLFDQVDLSVRSGTVLQIAGGNGVGKTSLLRILCGLSPPEDGDIFWDGVPIRTDPIAYRTELAFLGHVPGVKLDLTARENLAFSCAIAGRVKSHSIDDALGKVNLTSIADLSCRHLSEGQRRRVAIARLYLNAARLWILDEPLAAIDQNGIEAFLDHLDAHLDDGGLAVVTSHQPVSLKRHRVETFALGEPR